MRGRRCWGYSGDKNASPHGAYSLESKTLKEIMSFVYLALLSRVGRLC